MARIDASPDHALLVRTLRSPDSFAMLTVDEVSRLIDAARDARLLGWLLTLLDTRGAEAMCPEWLRDRIGNQRALASEYERAIRWETNRLHRALTAACVPWVLLKGAAYVAASLPPGRGRRVADIDVLVPFDRLADAERALREAGWQSGTLDPYDDRYYREWMHEIPPMRHRTRRSIVDLHHAILPLTSRLRPPTPRLLERAVRVGDARVLSPAHMVLHAAAHLFHDGEVTGAIRDVVDVDGLLRHFGTDRAFWSEFVSEADALGLTRPAYYAVRYARRLMSTPVPEHAARDIDAWAPPPVVQRLMDALVDRALPGLSGPGAKAAAVGLYVRSHWLRMPPLMLTRHLLHQATRRDRH
jgi:hypothetical protein